MLSGFPIVEVELFSEDEISLPILRIERDADFLGQLIFYRFTWIEFEASLIGIVPGTFKFGESVGF